MKPPRIERMPWKMGNQQEPRNCVVMSAADYEKLLAEAQRLDWLLTDWNLGAVAEGNGRYEACWTYKDANETRDIIDEKRSATASEKP